MKNVYTNSGAKNHRMEKHGSGRNLQMPSYSQHFPAMRRPYGGLCLEDIADADLKARRRVLQARPEFYASACIRNAPAFLQPDEAGISSAA